MKRTLQIEDVRGRVEELDNKTSKKLLTCDNVVSSGVIEKRNYFVKANNFIIDNFGNLFPTFVVYGKKSSGKFHIFNSLFHEMSLKKHTFVQNIFDSEFNKPCIMVKIRNTLTETFRVKYSQRNNFINFSSFERMCVDIKRKSSSNYFSDELEMMIIEISGRRNCTCFLMNGFSNNQSNNFEMCEIMKAIKTNNKFSCFIECVSVTEDFRNKMHYFDNDVTILTKCDIVNGNEYIINAHKYIKNENCFITSSRQNVFWLCDTYGVDGRKHLNFLDTLKKNYADFVPHIVVEITNKLRINTDVNDLVIKVVIEESQYIDNLKKDLISKLENKQKIDIGHYTTFEQYFETKKNIKDYYLNIFSSMLGDVKYKYKFEPIMNSADKKILERIEECERVISDEDETMKASGRKGAVVYHNYSNLYINALLKEFNEQLERIIPLIDDITITEHEITHGNPEIKNLIDNKNRLNEFLRIISQ
jgi:hypothetical protein